MQHVTSRFTFTCLGSRSLWNAPQLARIIMESKRPLPTSKNMSLLLVHQATRRLTTRVSGSPDEVAPDELARLLALGNSGDRNARQGFYAALISSKLFLLSAQQDGPVGSRVANENETLNVQTIPDPDGIPHVILFSSLASLKAAGGGSWVCLTGKDILRATKGAHFILNPGTEHSKVLVPAEVEKLLDGSLLMPLGLKGLTLPAGTKVRIGQPAEYPTAIVAALSRVFDDAGCVRAAYLGAMQVIGSADSPASTRVSQDVVTSIVVGLQQSGDWNAVLGLASQAIAEIGGDTPVDLVEISTKQGACADSVAEYLLRSTQPFYVKTS